MCSGCLLTVHAVTYTTAIIRSTKGSADSMTSDAQHHSKQAVADRCICTTEPKACWCPCWRTCMADRPPRRGIWGTQSLQVRAHSLRPPAHLPGAAFGWGSPCAPVRIMLHSQALELSHSHDTRHALQCLCAGVCEGYTGSCTCQACNTICNTIWYARHATKHACCCRCLALMTRHALQCSSPISLPAHKSMLNRLTAGRPESSPGKLRHQKAWKVGVGCA